MTNVASYPETALDIEFGAGLPLGNAGTRAGDNNPTEELEG